MTVRDRVGRTRYVAFRIAQGGPVPRSQLAGALPAAAKLTRFDGTHGILRLLHRDQRGLLQALEGPLRVGGREVVVETLVTSGTIRKAAEALPAGSPAAKRGRKPPR